MGGFGGQEQLEESCPSCAALSVHRTVPVQGRLHRTDVLGRGAAAVPSPALQGCTGRVHRYCLGSVLLAEITDLQIGRAHV